MGKIPDTIKSKNETRKTFATKIAKMADVALSIKMTGTKNLIQKTIFTKKTRKLRNIRQIRQNNHEK